MTLLQVFYHYKYAKLLWGNFFRETNDNLSHSVYFFPYGKELRGGDESSTFMMTRKNFCDGIYEKTNVKVLFS